MRRIIEGKRYDTRTAEVIGSYDNGYHQNDFHWLEETLYRTPSGQFFLHGEGGGMSVHRRSVEGRMWTSGETLNPMTDGQAMCWLEERGLLTALEEYFAESIADA